MYKCRFSTKLVPKNNTNAGTSASSVSSYILFYKCMNYLNMRYARYFKLPLFLHCNETYYFYRKYSNTIVIYFFFATNEILFAFQIVKFFIFYSDAEKMQRHLLLLDAAVNILNDMFETLMPLLFQIVQNTIFILREIENDI